MILDLEPPDNPLPNYSVDLGGGYVLLRAHDRYNYHPGETETQLIREFLNGPVLKFKRWARLRLSNGQIAHCAWKEKLKLAENVHMSCNVKVSINNKSEIAEVLYFAQLAIMVHADNINENHNDEEFEYIDDEIYHFVTVAMVSVYSCLDPQLLQKSAQTVWSCTYHGNEAL
ncbi:hypothetical protein P692DRAFT_20881587 [Suillus brevipes Sb2]|nr:hypothetical protein P692DRAFT_20881587 [Suillus brevipes Sb2]